MSNEQNNQCMMCKCRFGFLVDPCGHFGDGVEPLCKECCKMREDES